MAELDIQIKTLQSGLRVITVPMPALKSMTVLAMVGVGSRFESDETAGISHFLEHLPFKGTQNYPTSLDIATAIDGVGGKHNAFTSKEYTGYWVKVASKQWKLGLDVVSDLLLTARLREEDIEREKGVIVEEINMYEDEPQAKVADIFDSLVFKDSPLYREIIGSKKTVTSFTQKDFMNHWNTWYDPTNVVVGIVGGSPDDIDMTSDAFMDVVGEYFAKGNERLGGGVRTFGMKQQTKPRLNVFYKKTEQAHFHLGVPGVSREDPDRYTLTILTTLLGGNSSSRLFNEIREKRGLAYYAYASADVFQDTGSLYALEGVTLNKIEEAIAVTLEEFDKVTQGTGVTSEEVERSKEYVIGKMTLDLEDSASVANMVVRKALLEGQVVTVEEVIEKIRAVDKDSVVALAGRLLDRKKLNLAVVGPFKNEETFAKLLV
jgi:predicted Zn-dependent peptidase